MADTPNSKSVNRAHGHSLLVVAGLGGPSYTDDPPAVTGSGSKLISSGGYYAALS